MAYCEVAKIIEFRKRAGQDLFGRALYQQCGGELPDAGHCFTSAAANSAKFAVRSLK
jgi:hypothetical protein